MARRNDLDFVESFVSKCIENILSDSESREESIVRGLVGNIEEYRMNVGYIAGCHEAISTLRKVYDLFLVEED